MKGPLAVCCRDGRGPVFWRGGDRAKAFGRPLRGSGERFCQGTGPFYPGLGGFGRIRAGGNGRPDGHTARSDPSSRLLAPGRGERRACGGMLEPGLSADQASPGTVWGSFVESYSLLIEAPLRVMRCALLSSLSRMASPKVGSPTNVVPVLDGDLAGQQRAAAGGIRLKHTWLKTHHLLTGEAA